jgi:hypothetical protein
MLDLTIRCSALGAIMTEPVSVDADQRTPEVQEIINKTKRTDEEKAILAAAKERSLSAGAKTAIRKLVREAIFGVDVEIDAKEIQKGLRLEPDAIAMVNRQRGLSLAKNTERRTDGLITGECDLFDAERNRGHDTKVSWSVASFPIGIEDCEDQGYFWQAQGYMRLWCADEWDVDYCLLSTPDDLIRYEPIQMHVVDHIEERLRLTTWTIKRDPEAQRLIPIKVEAARRYAARVVREFDIAHAASQQPAPDAAAQEVAAPVAECIASTARASGGPADQVARFEREGAEVHIADIGVGFVRLAAAAAPTSNEPATLKLGVICERLGFTVRADFLADVLHIPHRDTDKAAKLYRESDFPLICAQLQSHISAMAELYAQQKAA